jgi:hypothetical protein
MPSGNDDEGRLAPSSQSGRYRFRERLLPTSGLAVVGLWVRCLCSNPVVRGECVRRCRWQPDLDAGPETDLTLQAQLAAA